MTDTQRQAYKIGGRAVRQVLAQRAPRTHRALERMQSSDVVVVRGSMDHVEWVLDALGLPYLGVDASRLRQVSLSPRQTVIVNCPGRVPAQAIAPIRRFVEQGGRLFTTDWALNLLEKAFPGNVRFNQRSTEDEVVPVRQVPRSHPLLEGVTGGPCNPQWWLEYASHPIQVLHPGVEVLLASWKLEERYGHDPVAVRFEHGRGDVVHMISHYYLQRTELRDARHRAGAEAWFSELGLVPDEELGELRLGELESAATSARFLANILADKARRG
ncbi:MAG: hypothetical protein AB1758_35715, partial [Candidatus Eremiobacterota bacterium]